MVIVVGYVWECGGGVMNFLCWFFFEGNVIFCVSDGGCDVRVFCWFVLRIIEEWSGWLIFVVFYVSWRVFDFSFFVGFEYVCGFNKFNCKKCLRNYM